MYRPGWTLSQRCCVEHMSNYTRLALYTDGASRGNPGPAASGVHIVDDTTRETVAGLGFVLGIATNNVAEYQAVLHAVEWLLAHRELLADEIQINFCMDSKLVASQLSGQWKIKDSKMRQLPGTYTFSHIPREENKEADRLANHTLDKQS